MKNLLKSVVSKKHFLLNRYSIFIINGFALAASLFFLMQDNYEKNLVSTLSNSVKTKYSVYNSEDSLVIGSLHMTHFIEERRKKVFSDQNIKESISDWLQPLSNDLM